LGPDLMKDAVIPFSEKYGYWGNGLDEYEWRGKIYRNDVDIEENNKKYSIDRILWILYNYSIKRYWRKNGYQFKSIISKIL
jgi:hypothetical protein